MGRIRRSLSYANVMATGAMFVALGGGAYAVTGVPDRSGVFHGCVSNKTGVLRVVKSARFCRKPSGRGKRRNPGEFAISWNQQGPTGATGAAGATGATGATGAAGATGLGFGTVVAKAASYTIDSGDNGHEFTFNGSSLTVTLPATAPTAPWMVTIINLNASTLTISPSGRTLNGSTSNITLGKNQNVFVWSDGTNYVYGSGCPATSALQEVPTNGGQTGGSPPFGEEGASDSVIPSNGAKVVCTPSP